MKLGLLHCVLMSSLLLVAAGSHADSTRETAVVGARTREWVVHLPAGYQAGKPLPLVIAYHGRGGTAVGMERFTHLDEVADRDGFIAVYPSGVDESWGAGVDADADKEGVDDVAFTAALLTRLESEYSIDKQHIVLTGFSDGAHMVQLLGCRLADRITAIVPVSGTLAREHTADCKPARPLTVVEFHGTADPIDPYQGGLVSHHALGSVESVDETLAEWAQRDHCQAKPVETSQTPVGDGTQLIQRDYSSCAPGVEVHLYKILGAGHTWPAGPQYLPERYIGRATKAINASSVIGEIAEGRL